MLDTHENGKALIEPMYYEYPEYEEAYRCPNQYFFGGELLVAPVTTKGDEKGMAKTTVWLPEGKWTDIFTGDVYEGGRTVDMVRFLDTIPVLAKEGGFFVLDTKKHTNDISAPTHLQVMAFNGNGEYLFREDEAVTTFTAKAENCKQTVSVRASEHAITRKMTLELRNITDGNVTVYADGEKIDADVNADGYLIVTLDEVKPNVTYTVDVEFEYCARAYRNARYLSALTRIEAGTDYKDMLWNLREKDDAVLRAAILLDAVLTENEKIRLTESW
jgi:hypothetical protein